ncbi:uncharacterized protein LOC119399704 isoform X2 [Rhipicephalus sanguineus]|uniref:uncharacterized protein LOC119399704 isoform X2 n=1 Tax=Rhipicephalus sanguineus TaxID=34632 RepID=UPI001896023C|nr:uncharacterized protein LOC119399704 isoform X2 [Rhipicephalus sanguineus]
MFHRCKKLRLITCLHLPNLFLCNSKHPACGVAVSCLAILRLSLVQCSCKASVARGCPVRLPTPGTPGRVLLHPFLFLHPLQMPLTLPEQITMEKTPSYFVTEEVPARIRSTLPDARLLVVVRDPVTRALSDYAQTASKRPDTTLPFEVLAFRRRRRRRDGDSTSNTGHHPLHRRRTRGRNGSSSPGRTWTSGGSGKVSAAPRYNTRDSVRRTFVDRPNDREDHQRRHLPHGKEYKYSEKAVEDRQVTVSNEEALHNEEDNFISYRRSVIPNGMYATRNMTKYGEDWVSQNHRYKEGNGDNAIPKDVPYVIIKKKSTSVSSKDLRTEARSDDNKMTNQEDLIYKATNRDCGPVGRSNNNGTCWNASNDVDEAWSGIRIGLYANHLAHWLRHFPQSQIHVVSGEELVRNPAREMAMVQDFLGLRRLVSEDHFYFNRTKGFPCLKKSEGSGSPHCLGKTKGRTHPRLSEENVRRLRKFFEPHNVKFYKLVGRDFGWERAR